MQRGGVARGQLLRQSDDKFTGGVSRSSYKREKGQRRSRRLVGDDLTDSGTRLD